MKLNKFDHLRTKLVSESTLITWIVSLLWLKGFRVKGRQRVSFDFSFTHHIFILILCFCSFFRQIRIFFLAKRKLARDAAAQMPLLTVTDDSSISWYESLVLRVLA